MANTEQTETPSPPGALTTVPNATQIIAVSAADPEVRPLTSHMLDYIDPRRWLETSSGRAIPLLGAMVLMWLFFEAVTPNGEFFSPGNVTNILVYTSQYGIVAVGIVIVLLLGEIDLSLGSLVGLSGCCAAAIMLENLSWGITLPWVGSVGFSIDFVPTAAPIPKMLIGVAAALTVGLVCGVFTGFWVAVVKIPSFVVSLAGLLAFFGLGLVVTNAQTLPITDPYFNALGASGSTAWDKGFLGTFVGSNTSPFLHISIGMILAVIVGVAYTLSLLASARVRAKSGLARRSAISICAQGLVLTACVLGLVLVLDKYEGVPIPVFIFITVLIVFSYVTRRTRFGRHVYATGGNAEAARRSGINVRRVRWSAFVLSGLLAGVVGVVFMAYSNGANGGTPDQSFLLLVIASAVIGGTSLFGGRGSVWSALIGALIVSSLQTGMQLTLASNTNSEYYEYIVEAAILLAAVWLDTFAKSRSTVDRTA